MGFFLMAEGVYMQLSFLSQKHFASLLTPPQRIASLSDGPHLFVRKHSFIESQALGV